MVSDGKYSAFFVTIYMKPGKEKKLALIKHVIE